jgi:ubiquitin C-terminal hydrolase
MDAFRADLQPKLFTLKNDGVLCYFNSLMQALMSCPALNAYIIEHSSEFAKNTLAQAYITLFTRSAKTSDELVTSMANMSIQQEDTKFQPIHIDNAGHILRLLCALRDGKRDNLSPYKQEDAQEGFTLFLDALGDEVSKKFQVRYKCEIICRQCHARHFVDTSEYREPTEMMIDLSEENPFSDISLDTKENVEAYIHRNMQVPRDYKCEKCATCNTYDKVLNHIVPNICQNYTLARVSEIVVLLFKKYKQKQLRYFPPTLDFRSRTGMLQYRIVAQIEHFGTMGGGHYRVKCLRTKPPGLHHMRQQRAQKIYDRYTHQLVQLSRPDVDDTTTYKIILQMTELKKNMEEDNKLASDKMGVFLLDDERVNFCPEGFEPTPNTYMVFYHLWPSD